MLEALVSLDNLEGGAAIAGAIVVTIGLLASLIASRIERGKTLLQGSGSVQGSGWSPLPTWVAALTVVPAAIVAVSAALIVSANNPSPDTISPSTTDEPSANPSVTPTQAESPGHAVQVSGEDAGGLGSWVLVLAGGLLVALGVGAIVLLLMRRREDDSNDDHPSERPQYRS
ncbi:hypothetical protein [Plantactinospora sp. KLBMP9567]|uniref:hypothetical protein n=1 Tax=Plantactinospora sp. KLBMP9567 TaxID=3085900 RepID=UPI002981E586|nr:hypothetical protein [Plantactinospora sp. KLBMP9567]MDW5330814.1 hypothetical protein [Plantactinospora sp. KLBMP9567]